MKFVFGSMCLSVGLAAAATAAVAPLPANDTYLDNSYTSGGTDYRYTNHGHFGVIKAVYNSVDTAPYGKSKVHSLFTLPQQFLSEAVGGVSTAIVQFNVKTPTLSKTAGGITYTATVSAYPLMHNFVAGTGGNATKTQDPDPPLAPNSPTPYGADWFTYDGKSTDTWTSPGGDYDTTGTPVGYLTDSNTHFNLDIAALVNNPITFAEIRDNGLLLRIDQDNDLNFYSPNLTLSLASADKNDDGTVNGYGAPGSVIYTVPEPASMATASVGCLLLSARRRRR